MENIQTDVFEDILACLPIESRLQSKQVCKTWRNLVGKNTKVGLLFAFSNVCQDSDIQFYYSEYPMHHEINFQKLQYVKLSSPEYNFYYSMVGSCNGLICLAACICYAQWQDPVIVINPVTGKYSRLPIYSSESKEDDFVVAAGFGYVHSTNQYKVVRIHSKVTDKYTPHVHVYTLGSPLGWREITENVPLLLLFSYTTGVFANGLLHWVNEKGKRCNIVSFDMVDECFYNKVPSPPLDYSNYTHSQLFLLGGYLCLHVWANKCIQIWSFKSNADDNTWSWCKDFSINCDEPLTYQAFAITKSNEVLFWHRQRTLCSYDSKTSTLNKLWETSTLNKLWDTIKGSYIPAIPHINSLISVEIQNGQNNL